MIRDDGAAARGDAAEVVFRDGIRWHVDRSGSGPPLLLVHGTGASSHSFSAIAGALARRFTVIAPDLPGHARSRAPAWFEPSLPHTAAALGRLLDALGAAPAVAIGHSAGAAVVARMTLDGVIAPRLLVGLGAALVPFRGVARAVFPSTARALSRSRLASKLIALGARERRVVERLVSSTGSRLGSEGVDRYRELSTRPDHVAAVLTMMASWDLDPLYAALPRLDVPLLLVAGASDRAIPPADQRRIAARAPRGRLVVIERAGHLVHEERPDEVTRVVLEEIDRVAGDGAS